MYRYILDLGTSWTRVVSFTPRPLYPLGKSPCYPLDRRLGGPQNDLKDVKKRKFLTLPGLELRPLGRPPRSQSLYGLRYRGSFLRCVICGYLFILVFHKWRTFCLSFLRNNLRNKKLFQLEKLWIVELNAESSNYELGSDTRGLVVRVLGYRSRGPLSIPGSTRFSEK
jgi:hypothetical protein